MAGCGCEGGRIKERTIYRINDCSTSPADVFAAYLHVLTYMENIILARSHE